MRFKCTSMHAFESMKALQVWSYVYFPDYLKYIKIFAEIFSQLKRKSDTLKKIKKSVVKRFR